MSEIKIGEYVRNESGYIHKIDSVDKLTNFYIDEENNIREWVGETVLGDVVSEKIVKHFKDIKELIREGDILRYKINNLSAYKIKEVKKYKDARSFKEYLGVEGFGLEQIIILNVLTKEQFMQNCYEVEE